MICCKYHGDTLVIEMRPNRSASWQQVKYALLLFAIPVFIIALGWALSGVWIILPFAGFELGLLALFMYRINWQTHHRQTLVLTDRTLIIRQGYRLMTERHLCRDTCRFEICRTEQDWQPPRCFVCGQDQRIAIGSFLNTDDSKLLCHQLLATGVPTCDDKWWQQ